ncbi:MAG TPA: N-acetyltransferase [Brevundimonas sp.]|jgi:hypothetical protein|uniref:N-acetyltransferase n=1 Tax=Brevundimonas sp. TaxID=1871086 RepID=UPI002DF6F473|nr:N-acetyltransferase [Brevundimonas sp.]
MTTPIRPFRPHDPDEVALVAGLHAGVGWPVRTFAGWRWLAANPAAGEAPVAWVAVDGDDRPVGVLGNLRLRCVGAGQALTGATGYSVVTAEHGRGSGTRLVRTFVQQDEVFAVWTFNANPAGAPLYGRLGMAPWPGTTHALKLAWIVDPVACAMGRALRLAAHDRRVSDLLGERLVSRRLDGDWHAVGADGGVEALVDFGPGSAWDAYRLRLAREMRLRPDRSPEVMAWRDADPQATWPAVTLGRFEGRELVAHARARLAKGNSLEVTALEILDLDWVEGHDRHVPELVAALFDMARSRGVAKLRLQVVSGRVLAALGSWGERARREGGWGHCKLRWTDAPPGSAVGPHAVRRRL